MTTISHGPNGDTIRPTDVTLTNLGTALHQVLPGHNWAVVAYLFARPNQRFDIDWRDAQQIATTLQTAVHTRQMSLPLAGLAERIAWAANCAAEGHETWRWS